MIRDPALPRVFRRPDALAAGMTRAQIETRIRTGVWVVLRRGVFCLRATLDQTPPGQRHLLHAAAAQLACSTRDLVVSHISAAAHWGLPMPLDQQPRAALTDGCTTRSTQPRPDAVIQVASLWPGDVWTRGSVILTSPARTVADCLRHYSAEVSVPIADAALHLGLTTPGQINDVLEREALWPYAARATHSWPMVDGLRESWLESISAVAMVRQGLGRPEAQVEVLDASGRFVARVDFLWTEHATVGEADGQSKYRMSDDLELGQWADLAQAGSDDLSAARVEGMRRVVRREKRREDALRDLGLEVVRWGTAEVVQRPGQLAERVRRAWRRGDPSRFTGRVRLPRAA
jgi:hypothetical protein